MIAWYLIYVHIRMTFYYSNKEGVMKFNKMNEYGMTVYTSDLYSDMKITEINGSFKIMCKKHGEWKFIDSDFKDIISCQKFVEDLSSKLTDEDINMIKRMYCMDETWDNMEDVRILYTDRKYKNGEMFQIRIRINPDGTFNSELFSNYELIELESDLLTKDNLILSIDNFLEKCGCNMFEAVMCGREYRHTILCASSRDLMKNLVRVKSSNVWGYYLDIKNRKDKTGDLIVQFKNKGGGPGDVYLYFDVPVMLYRKWHTATSAGHFFWKYIRNDFKYRKLTGDKRGKLKNAVN